MLEDFVSVWQTVTASDSALRGNEGELVSVSIPVEASDLEELLDILATLSFPINPEIDHAAVPTTTVEFPAYAGDLAEIRHALTRAGFDASAVRTTSMFEQIQTRSAATSH